MQRICLNMLWGKYEYDYELMGTGYPPQHIQIQKDTQL
jgi:hypothetical protein